MHPNDALSVGDMEPDSWVPTYYCEDCSKELHYPPATGRCEECDEEHEQDS